MPKNPWLADRLLADALRHLTGEPQWLEPLDDRLEQEAHEAVAARIRQRRASQERRVVAATSVSFSTADRMRRLAIAALVVLTGFLASRVLGVVRSIVVAAHFGTGTDAAAYVAAITVTDTVFQVLVGGAVGSAFIPVFQRYTTHAASTPRRGT